MKTVLGAVSSIEERIAFCLHGGTVNTESNHDGSVPLRSGPPLVEDYMDITQSAAERILARRDELSIIDWYDLLEARRKDIAPHLRDMTLRTLGDLRVVGRTMKNPRRLAAVNPGGIRFPGEIQRPRMLLEGDLSAGYETRGIFPDDDIFFNGHYHVDHQYKEGAVGETITFWGLARTGSWLLVRVTCHYEDLERHPPADRTRERTALIDEVSITAADPSEICRCCVRHPRHIWERLGRVVHEWVAHRQTLLAQSEAPLERI